MTRIHRGPLTGRTVLVTGATGGIGKATAVGSFPATPPSSGTPVEGPSAPVGVAR